MANDSMRRKLRRFHAALSEARRTGVPADELFEQREATRRVALERSLEQSAGLEHARAAALERSLEFSEQPISRRRLLAGSAAFAAAALMPPAASGATAPRVVVVGGGFAGLTAAYRIRKLTGWVPEVYEAQGRVGGRARTLRTLAGGQYTEAGPSGINSGDRSLRDLCDEVGLTPLVDTALHTPEGDEVYRFGGKFYGFDDLRPGLRDIADAGWRAWKQIGRRIPTYRLYNEAAERYDGMSVAEFLAGSTDHGSGTPAGAYSISVFGVEYGGRANEASSLHHILEQGDFWGSGYDERWAVPGGNDRLAQVLAGFLPDGALHLDHALIAIRRNRDGSYRLTFDNSGALRDVTADRVVLAIPPTLLRRVDTSKAGFGKRKRRSFRQEGMGDNTKLNLQFAGRPWSDVGRSGDGVTDMVTASFWQASFLGTDPAILVVMNNESYGSVPAHGRLSGAHLQQTLQAVDALFPGASGRLIDGQAYLDCWPNDPWVRGSYAFNPVGGFTTYQGIQEEPRGTVSFAGEHTASYTRKGSMAGAVESGERSALEVANG